MGRKQARVGTMQLLYQMDSNKEFTEEVLDTFLDNFEFDLGEEEYINHAFKLISENKELIDQYIANNLEGWSIYRLAKVDLAVLRIAIYEILYRDDIPREVSINEAIEIVKKYSNTDSFRFINGVLGGFVREIDNKDS